MSGGMANINEEMCRGERLLGRVFQQRRGERVHRPVPRWFLPVVWELYRVACTNDRSCRWPILASSQRRYDAGSSWYRVDPATATPLLHSRIRIGIRIR